MIKHVNLTLTLILGLSISILFFSCSKKITSSNYKNNYYFDNILYNSILGIKITFFGDINSIDISSNRKQLIKELKNNKFSTEDINNVIFFGKTVIEPNYKLLVFNGLSDKSKSRLKLMNSNDRYIYDLKQINNLDLFIYIYDFERKDDIVGDFLKILSSVEEFNENELSYQNIFQHYISENNILYVVDKIKFAPVKKGKLNEFYKNQFLLTLYSFFNYSREYEYLLNSFESKRKVILKPIIDSIIDEYKAQNIYYEFNRLIKESQIVIINENHWKPNNRVFLRKLIPIFSVNDFSYLAIEAIDRKNFNLNNKSNIEINKNLGYYVREPEFQNLLDDAIANNLSIIPYDDVNSINREKEIIEIIKPLLYEGKKIAIYVGFDHVIENNNKNKKWLAQVIKEELNIDPLTISQTELVYDSDSSFIIPSSKVKSEHIITGVDYFFINNLKKTIHTEITVEVKLNKKPLKRDLIVQYFPLEMYQKNKHLAIPRKIELIENHNAIKILLKMSKGSYLVKISDSNMYDYYYEIVHF